VNKQSILVNMEELNDIKVPAFGFELLREVLLPDILGQDHPQMLYWAGKGLARKYPVNSIEELSTFFESAGWGSLTLLHKKNNEMEFELDGELISIRFNKANDYTFQLEAGFIAEQLQSINKHITETYEHVKKRANKVVFTVKWDHKDILDEQPIIGKRSKRKL
jgi:predicted hydrocarbon binding protein